MIDGQNPEVVPRDVVSVSRRFYIRFGIICLVRAPGAVVFCYRIDPSVSWPYVVRAD